MSANVPSSASPPRARRAHPASACQAEAIGVQLERIYREIDDRGDTLGEYHTRCGEHWNEEATEQLRDRARLLGSQLEWIKATSLRGVAAQAGELQRAIERSREDVGLEASHARRIDRLSHMISAAIGDLIGAAPGELARDVGNADPDVFAETLLRHTGQRIGDGEVIPFALAR